LFSKKRPIIVLKTDVTDMHPNWAEVKEELSKKGMTRLLLWEELKSKEPPDFTYQTQTTAH